MTDNEIIKALRKHSTDLCSNCKVEKTTLCNECISEIERNALDLINRQQEEIERLKRELETKNGLVLEIFENKSAFERVARAKAIKEFAERLKELKEMPLITNNDIDNLVKEMTDEAIEQSENPDCRQTKINKNAQSLVKTFAEQVKMAFYYEFDEIIPSIMADKIDNLVKEMVGEQE